LLTKIDEYRLDPNLMPQGPKFKYLTAMGEAGFVDFEPEVFQFGNPREPDAVPRSMAK